jgi:hypothetical protein
MWSADSRLLDCGFQVGDFSGNVEAAQGGDTGICEQSIQLILRPTVGLRRLLDGREDLLHVIDASILLVEVVQNLMQSSDKKEARSQAAFRKRPQVSSLALSKGERN